MKLNNLVKRGVSLLLAALFVFVGQISASAADIAPKLSVYAVFADRIVISTDNAGDFASNVRFEVRVSNHLVKTVKKSGAKKISLYDNGKYFKPDTNYTITVTPVDKNGEKAGRAASISVKTASSTYYTINKGTSFYKPAGGKMKKISSAKAKTYAKGALCSSSGVLCAGKSIKTADNSYVKLLDGSGMYVKASDVSRALRVTAQRYIVSEYGKSMNGGSYIYGAASFRRTDCSGLTMQCYAQIGQSISHSVSSQATKGKSVSVNSMQPGDLIILNYRSHVAMYVGNGKMVHAMNSYDGIKVEPVSKLKYYHVDTVRRLIF